MSEVIGYRAYSGTGRDARGNVVDQWADEEQVTVMGWYVVSTTDPPLAGHDRVTADVQVIAGPGFSPTTRDLITLPIGEFEVVGITEDWNHGPFGWSPGNIVNLVRTEG